VIARLDDGLLQAQLRSAQASYDLAANTLKRYEEASSGVTKLQIDNSRSQKLTTKSQVDQLLKQISYCVIKAPFAGIISKKSVEMGAIVSTGTPMATLIYINSLKLEISVPEKDLSKFKEKMELKITSDVYPDAAFTGDVSFIGSQADDSHNYSIKILVHNQDKAPLKAGMYGNVTVSTPSVKSISIPRSAISGSSSDPKVYVVKNGTANLRSIKLGAGNEIAVQVISGLSANETVVTGGLVNLTDGSLVEIK
jgi:RND family efflux transporter MFP subunit